jgi:plasmid stabilization system protein ParE
VKYRIRAAAERDLDEAASWYGEHAVDPRTAIRFLLEVRATFELIAQSPGAFAEIHGDIRRCPCGPSQRTQSFIASWATSW